MIHGSCLCKEVTFTINGNLHSGRYCHCDNCRKFSGTSPAAWAMAQSADVVICSANNCVSKFNSGRGQRCFCSHCGSPLWFESLEYPDTIAIPLGVLDHGYIPPLRMHIWTQSRPTWCAIHDELPQHKTYP
ncbi:MULTISPECIES: GFA family protein [unclassified Pseudoalteromonas]|uniref:GFA family protein n=1 Tax=unclassified Pseudoalteromonas TaxID=194690 RepID=UPI0009E5D7DB|nr:MULTISPECIES: GFA family protein [unclassified Pseudoalteromonas]